MKKFLLAAVLVLISGCGLSTAEDEELRSQLIEIQDLMVDENALVEDVYGRDDIIKHLSEIEDTIEDIDSKYYIEEQEKLLLHVQELKDEFVRLEDEDKKSNDNLSKNVQHSVSVEEVVKNDEVKRIEVVAPVVVQEDVESTVVVESQVVASVKNEVLEEPGIVVLELFYGEECPHCHKELAWLDSLDMNKYPNLRIEKYETWHDEENSDLFKARMNELGEVAQGVPTNIIGREVVVGFSDELKEKILGLIDGK